MHFVSLLLEPPNQAQIASARQRRLEGKGDSAPRKNSISLRTSLPARTAAASGENGDIPLAIKSALMKFWQFAYQGRNLLANVVLPTPFGPAIM
jgi:hypothetical protein